MKRSSEEFEMRRILTPWLRNLVPGARIVHELVVGGDRRIDMAAIGADTVVGVEIKSSRDTLDRLDGQMRRFKTVLPLTVLAVSPKWHDAARGYGHVITVDPTGVDRRLHGTEYLSIRSIDRTVTVPVLWLLWAPELRNITARLRLSGNPRATMRQSIELLARRATGDEILREACRELRARDAFPKSSGHPESDPPILAEVVQ